MAKITNTRVCFTGSHQVKLEVERLSQQIEPHQMLIRTLYTLISAGTELAMYTQSHAGFNDPEHPWAKYPFYPGYAAVGQVEVVGSAVRRFQAGDRIYYRGKHQHYTILSPLEELVLEAPDGLPLEWVPFTRMAQIANTALLVSNVSPESRVAVVGLGIVGNLAAQLFQLAGAKVFGLDLIASRCELAQRCGIARVINPDEQNSVPAIKEVTGGQGVHVVVEASGNPALVHPALEMAQPRGEVILLGSPRGSAEVDLYNLIHRKGVSLKGAHEALFPPVSQRDNEIDQQTISRQMLQHVQNKQVIVEPLISQIISPGQIEAGYQALLCQKETAVGVLIAWSETWVA